MIIGNGVNYNCHTQRRSFAYPLLPIRAHLYIRYSRWRWVSKRNFTVVCGDEGKAYGTSGSILAYAYCYKFMLLLCKKASGTVSSLILALELIFSAKKQENVQMLHNSHLFLCSKDSIIFLLKQDSLMCCLPTMPPHLLFLIILNFSKCEYTQIK